MTKDYSRLAQIASEVQADYKVDAGRIERAKTIVENKEVRQVSSQRYEVQSQSKNARYLVNLDTVECGCYDAQKQHICKHYLACAIYHALPDVPEQQVWDDQVNAETRKLLESVGIVARPVVVSKPVSVKRDWRMGFSDAELECADDYEPEWNR